MLSIAADWVAAFDWLGSDLHHLQTAAGVSRCSGPGADMGLVVEAELGRHG